MIERYNLFSPRISGTFGSKNGLKIRGAWGLSYKAPSMITLYPGPVYFYLVNLSYYDPEPSERLAVVTSYIINPDNSTLKPSKGDTKEISAEWGTKGFNFKVTAYNKIIDRGISSMKTLLILKNQGYTVVSEPEGEPPVVEPDPNAVYYIPRTYTSYGNNIHSESKGIEFALSTPKLGKLKTSFNLTGQYIETISEESIPEIRLSNTSTSLSRYGVYENSKSIYRLFTANLTAIQPLPDLRMMITLTTELNIYKNSFQQDQSLFPVAYYNTTGEYIAIPESESANPEYADLVLSTSQFYPIKTPFYPNFHLQIRKETRHGHSFSFYANNCLWYNPNYTDKYTLSTTQLNSRISFGFGVGIKL